jgi:hypothetical protein
MLLPAEPWIMRLVRRRAVRAYQAMLNGDRLEVEIAWKEWGVG